MIDPARDTDRKHVSETLRLSGAWEARWYGTAVYLTKRGTSTGEHLVIRYGAVDQIVEAWHNWPGCRNGIVTQKRQRVLAIIEGDA